MQTQAEEEHQYKRIVSRPSFKVGVALNNSHKWHLLPSKIRSDVSWEQPEGGWKSQMTQHQCIYKIPNYHIFWVMELQGACGLITVNFCYQLLTPTFHLLPPPHPSKLGSSLIASQKPLVTKPSLCLLVPHGKTSLLCYGEGKCSIYYREPSKESNS